MRSNHTLNKERDAMPHFSAFAAETPDRPAYIMANTGQVVTYAELDRRSNQVAHLLRASGVRRGDHVAMMMKNCAEFLQVAQGALRAGIIFTPISTHLKQEENGSKSGIMVVSTSTCWAGKLWMAWEISRL